MKFDYEHGVIQWLDISVDMKNVRELENYLDIEDIGLQPKEAAYLNQLRELNDNYVAMDEDDFLCNDAWDNILTEILQKKIRP